MACIGGSLKRSVGENECRERFVFGRSASSVVPGTVGLVGKRSRPNCVATT